MAKLPNLTAKNDESQIKPEAVIFGVLNHNPRVEVVYDSVKVLNQIVLKFATEPSPISNLLDVTSIFINKFWPDEAKQANLEFAQSKCNKKNLALAIAQATLNPSQTWDHKRWVTLKPHGSESKGQHVLIETTTGEVIKGLGGKVANLRDLGNKTVRHNKQNATTHVQNTASQQVNAAKLGGTKTQRDRALAAMIKAALINGASIQGLVNGPQSHSAKAPSKLGTASLKRTRAVANPTVTELANLEANLIKACQLQLKGNLYDGIANLTDFLRRYRAGLAGSNISETDLHALFYGPDKYAQYYLRDQPSISFKSDDLQQSYDRLDACCMGASALLELHAQGQLTITAAKIAQLNQLLKQRQLVQKSYALGLNDYAAKKANAIGVELRKALPHSSITQLQQCGYNSCKQELLGYRQNGKLHVKPAVIQAIYQNDFRCQSPFVKTWLELLRLRGIILEYQSKLDGAQPSRWLKTINQLFESVEQSITLYHGCSLDAALDREFSFLFQQAVPFCQHHDVKAAPFKSVDIGHPMSLRDADSNHSNRDFKLVVIAEDGTKLRPFQINCQACVVSFEQRLRGVNVQAVPNYKRDKNDQDAIELGPEYLSHYTQGIWFNPETGAAPDTLYLDLGKVNPRQLPIALEHQLNQLIKTNQHFFLSWGWQRKEEGHIVALVKDRDGLHLHDAQSGELMSVAAYFEKLIDYTGDYQVNARTLQTYRVDNCEIMSDYAALVLTKEGRRPFSQREMQLRHMHLTNRINKRNT